MNIINSKIPIIISSIDRMQTDELSSSDIVSIIRIRRELTQLSEILAETQEKIFNSYGVTPSNGVYSWKTHEKSEEIGMKINELMNGEYKLMSTGKIAKDSFFNSVKGLSFSEIELLSNIMVIENEIKK